MRRGVEATATGLRQRRRKVLEGWEARRRLLHGWESSFQRRGSGLRARGVRRWERATAARRQLNEFKKEKEKIAPKGGSALERKSFIFNVQLFGRTRTDIDRRTSYHTTAVALHPTTMVAGRQPPTSPPQSYATVPMSPLTSTTPHGPKPHPYHHHNRTLRTYQNDNAATRCARQRSCGACATTQPRDDGDDHEDHDHDNGRSNGPGCGGTDDDGDDDGAAAGGIGGGDGDGGRDSERGDGDGDGDAGSGDADVDGDNGDRVATVVMRAWVRTVGTQTGTTLLLVHILSYE
ncbi:hypothetical protein EDB89DRAFT_1912569 [Lactarius sanguifluus]|nr:hypothetical protein EDB89DRAFT_1912569 [Lactarius sanguifluus]